MPIDDDEDIVRGLGFVTLYAAYLEEAIDECRQVLMQRDVQERLAQHMALPAELGRLPGLLDCIGELLERRNEVIHGRIYGGMQGDKDELRPGRPGGSAKPIDSAELYELANTMFDTLKPLNHASMFSLRRLLQPGSHKG